MRSTCRPRRNTRTGTSRVRVSSRCTHIDTLAERVTALGGTAEGALATVAKRTSLDPYPPDITDGSAHVDALASALAAFGRKARKAIGEADKLGDADTSDLFTGVSRDADKYLWFLEAHLQANA